jgi:hypothetical protein
VGRICARKQRRPHTGPAHHGDKAFVPGIRATSLTITGTPPVDVPTSGLRVPHLNTTTNQHWNQSVSISPAPQGLNYEVTVLPGILASKTASDHNSPRGVLLLSNVTTGKGETSNSPLLNWRSSCNHRPSMKVSGYRLLSHDPPLVEAMVGESVINQIHNRTKTVNIIQHTS